LLSINCPTSGSLNLDFIGKRRRQRKRERERGKVNGASSQGAREGLGIIACVKGLVFIFLREIRHLDLRGMKTEIDKEREREREREGREF